MPELTQEEFLKLSTLVNTERGRQSPEGQLIAGNPALLAQAESFIQEFSEETATERLGQSLNTLVSGPGIATDNIISGAKDTLLGASTLGINVLRAITPDDSTINQQLTAAGQQIKAVRDQNEIDTQVAIDETLKGDELTGAQSLAAEGIPKFAGEVLPFMYLPTGLSTYWRTVGYNGLVGVGIAGTTNKEAEGIRDQLGTMTLTGLGTAILAGAVHAPGGFRSFSARQIKKHLDTDLARTNQALEKEVQRITGNKDFSFDLAQVTANPFIVGLQEGAAKTATRDAQNAQMQTMIDFFKFRSNQLLKGGNVDQIATDLNSTILAVNKATNKRLSANFGAGLDNITAKFADDIVLDGREYLAGAKEALRRFTDPTLGGSSKSAPAFLTEQIAVLEKEIAETGGLSVDTTVNLLKSFRNISSGATPILEGASPGTAKNLAAELESVMMRSLDDTAMTNPEAIGAVQNLRNIYSFEKAQQRATNNSLLAGIFGVEDASAINAKTAFAQMVGRSEGAQRTMVKQMEALGETALLDQIRGEQVSQWVRASFVPATAQSNAGHNPAILATQIAGGRGAEGGGARGLFAPRDVIHFRKMGEALRTIDETYGSRFVQASGAEIQAGTINAISRNPAFFGRWMTQILSQGSFVEKMLLDPAFRESVIQVANKGLGTKASQSALIYMALTASGWRTEEERAAQQQKLAEARQGAAEDIGNNPAFAN